MAKNNKVDLNFYDKMVGFFSPRALNNRVIEKQKLDSIQRRDYVKQNYGVGSNPSKGVNKTNNRHIPFRREDARKVVRNSPFAQKGVQVIVNGVVGWGIAPAIKHDDEAFLKKVLQAWEVWSKKECSVDGKTDFFGLQQQVMKSVVTDGEILIKPVVIDGRNCLQVLEADFIVDKADNETFLKGNEEYTLLNGVLVDQYGRIVKYILYKQHPGEGNKTSIPMEEVLAKDVLHIYRKERPGQLRGLTWLNSVIYSLEHLQNLQEAHLTKLVTASAISGVITQAPNGLPPDLLQQERDRNSSLSAGELVYLQPGESIDFPTVPNFDGFEGSTVLALREIAAGFGITYEQISGDLSNTNFSSGRMGDLQFRANVEEWRWHLIIPQFLDPAFEVFKKQLIMKGLDAKKVQALECVWNPPARQMISPNDEISAIKDSIRSGLQTLPGALREQGIDPEKHIKEIAESNELLDKYGLILDTDPRRTSNQMLQNPMNLPNKKDESK